MGPEVPASLQDSGICGFILFLDLKGCFLPSPSSPARCSWGIQPTEPPDAEGLGTRPC